MQTRSPERAAYAVLDFGRAVYGYPRVRVRGRLGAIIDLGFANRSDVISDQLRYVCADEKSDWTAYKAVVCRYVLVRVSACPEEMKLDSVSIVEQQFVSERENAFDAEALSELWAVGLPSLVESRRESYLGETAARASWLQHYVLGLNDFYRAVYLQTLEAALQSASVPDSADESVSRTQCRCSVPFFQRWDACSTDCSAAESDAGICRWRIPHGHVCALRRRLSTSARSLYRLWRGRSR